MDSQALQAPKAKRKDGFGFSFAQVSKGNGCACVCESVFVSLCMCACSFVCAHACGLTLIYCPIFYPFYSAAWLMVMFMIANTMYYYDPNRTVTDMRPVDINEIFPSCLTLRFNSACQRILEEEITFKLGLIQKWAKVVHGVNRRYNVGQAHLRPKLLAKSV